MKSCTYRVSLSLTVFAVLGLAVPGGAQQPPALNLVPFKATMTGSGEGFLIPLSPPILSSHLSATGQADLLGQFTYVEHHVAHFGAEGQIQFFSDAVGVFSAANGDAIFLTYAGGVRPGANPNEFLGEFPFTIIGGRGRFAAAIGSGVIKSVAKSTPPKVEFTRTIEGTITAPKP
jgi:hypothetical protein